jgi:hypothetical protein
LEGRLLLPRRREKELRKNFELLPLLPLPLLLLLLLVGVGLVLLSMALPLLGGLVTIGPPDGKPGCAVPERTSPLGRLAKGISPPGILPAANAAASAAAPGGSGS